MKLFSQRIQESTCSDTNPGNGIDRLGVTNHYTPIDNIISNVRNLFACRMGIVVDKGEDNVSVKLHSTKFVSKEEINSILYNGEINRGTCLATYIQQQGLSMIKIIPVGMYYIVYFCPSDIKGTTQNPQAGQTAPEVSSKIDTLPVPYPCEQQYEAEVELDTIIKEDDEEELEDITKGKISELINSKDKVKSAKQLELLVGQEMELPREYYFAGVKAKTGEESIALRWKYTKRTGKGQTTEIVKTLINIYDEGKDGIFVADFDKDSMFQLPDEVKKLIENILEFLGAKETNDPAVWSLDGTTDKKEDDDDKKEDDEDQKDSDSDNKDSKSDDKKEDKEDSKSDDKKEDDDDDLLK